MVPSSQSPRADVPTKPKLKREVGDMIRKAAILCLFAAAMATTVRAQERDVDGRKDPADGQRNRSGEAGAVCGCNRRGWRSDQGHQRAAPRQARDEKRRRVQAVEQKQPQSAQSTQRHSSRLSRGAAAISLGPLAFAFNSV